MRPKSHIYSHLFQLSISRLIRQVNFQQQHEMPYRVPQHEPVERSQMEWGNLVCENFYIVSSPPLGRKQWLIYLCAKPNHNYPLTWHNLGLVISDWYLHSTTSFVFSYIQVTGRLHLLQVEWRNWENQTCSWVFRKKTSDLLSHSPYTGVQQSCNRKWGGEKKGISAFIGIGNLFLISEDASEHSDMTPARYYFVL